MGSGAVNVDGGNSGRLQTWLQREDAHLGGAEELDWLVEEARAELVSADDRERMAELAGMLAEWASEEHDDTFGAAALMHATKLAEDAGDVEAACDYAERAQHRDPTDPSPMLKLDRLLSASGDLARLEAARTTQVDLLAERAPLEHALRVDALRALALLRAEGLADLDSAIDAYQQAIEIDPDERNLEALAELYLRRDQPGDADDAAELYFQLAERAEPDAARPLVEQALDIQPDHGGALGLLQQLSELSGSAEDERLVSRMVAYASVAPAGDRRDSVMEELKARNSDVSELEEALGDSKRPAQASPAVRESFGGVPSGGPDFEQPSGTRPAPHALAAALAASGNGSAVTSTVPYASTAEGRPSAGVGRTSGASMADAGAPPAGGTLPFRPQQPTVTGVVSEVAGARPTAGRVYESAARPRGLSRRWIAWAGSAGLLTLAVVALVGIGGDESVDPPPESHPVDGAEAASTPHASADSVGAPGTPSRQADTEDARNAPEAPAGVQPASADVGDGSAELRRARPERQAKGPRAPRRRRPAQSSAAPAIGGVRLPPALLRVKGGSLERAALEARLEPAQRQLARCYRDLRKRAPRASGLIEYAFIVTRAGGTAKVRSLSGSLDANTVRLCGIRALRAARFPRPEGGAAHVRAVFDFSPPE